MGQKEEIISRINELGSRLSGLSSDEKRVKKRILQKLGKLKKELSRYTSNQDENNNEVNEITQKDNENDEQEDGKQSQESTKWTKKQCKLKLKITNSDIAELAQKKQSKAAQKKFNWCIKKGLTPGIIYIFISIYPYEDLSLYY